MAKAWILRSRNISIDIQQSEFPKVLLLDEPFSAVDAPTRMELQSLMLDLWTDNRFTAILVTHDIEEATFLG